MKTKCTITTCPHTGWRVNATPESDIPEEQLLEIAAREKAERNRRRSRFLSVASAVLIGLPFALPLVFFINGARTNYPLPVLLYPFLVLVFSFLSVVGGLLLYLASRKANHLRKPIGWITLAAFLLPTIGILFGDYLFQYDYTSFSKPVGLIILITLLLTLLCMLALGVFSALMLKKVFPKRLKPESDS